MISFFLSFQKIIKILALDPQNLSYDSGNNRRTIDLDKDLSNDVVLKKIHVPLCTHLSTDLMKLCRDKDLISRWERQTESMRRLGLCVAFGSKVKQVRLNTPGRLLIQEGEMVLVERRRKRKVITSSTS